SCGSTICSAKRLLNKNLFVTFFAELFPLEGHPGYHRIYASNEASSYQRRNFVAAVLRPPRRIKQRSETAATPCVCIAWAAPANERRKGGRVAESGLRHSTRNRAWGNPPWVRIPPLPPHKHFRFQIFDCSRAKSRFEHATLRSASGRLQSRPGSGRPIRRSRDQ